MIKFSIGICAYNEEKTISRLLNFLVKEKFKNTKLQKIIVVASGCTDRTEEAVVRFVKKYPLVKLLVEKERKGKSSAVNLIISESKNPVIVLISADVVPEKGAVEKLVNVLSNSEVGVVGGRIIPQNTTDNLIGFAVRLQWKLHHLVSLRNPKTGEMVAFKTIFKRINPKSAVDEAIIECLIATQGYRICYEPEAIVYNKGPETISDFLRQRRRIFAGHLATKKHYGYSVSTLELYRLIPYLGQVAEFNWRFFVYTPTIIGLEIIARCFGWFDYHFNTRDHSIWKIARSSKRIV